MQWLEKSTDYHELVLENVMVVSIIKRAEDEWIVQSSHGAPQGTFPTVDIAKRYAQKFARGMLEQALSILTQLEAETFATGSGRWRARSGRITATCGVLVVQAIVGAEATPVQVEQAKHKAVKDAQISLRAMIGGLE